MPSGTFHEEYIQRNSEGSELTTRVYFQLVRFFPVFSRLWCFMSAATAGSKLFYYCTVFKSVMYIVISIWNIVKN